jgi:phage portal protein BeeE
MKFLQRILQRAHTATEITKKQVEKIPFDSKLPNPIESFLQTSTGAYRDHPVVTDWSGERAYKEGMKSSHWVYRSVRFLGDTLSSVPIGAQIKQSDGRWVYAENHPLNLLLQNPNKHHDAKFFIENMVHNLSLGGNALWEK